MADTKQQFSNAIERCRSVFAAKLNDYGPSWRMLRPESLTDQMLIKARRIRTLETKQQAMVDEGILPEFIGLVNYGVIGLIQLQLGYADEIDITPQQAIDLYNDLIGKSTQLMFAKNHDYDEAWRMMRVSSFTDIILTKIMRNKEIEDNSGVTLVSEGVDSNLMDIINYALFGIIKLTEPDA